MSGPRFAIYFVPEQISAFYALGAALLGYDCYGGTACAHPADLGIDTAEWSDLTREPRLYGFHATMKAPFRLRSGTTERELADAVSMFTAARAPLPAVNLEVRLLDGFAALLPTRPCAPIDRLAAECVEVFDHFRAPLTPDERSRRLAAGLSPSQTKHLDCWGYPYVFEDFRWHMTITGRLPVARQAPVLDVIRERLRALGNAAIVPVDRLALVRQDGAGTGFRVVCNQQFKSAP